MGLGPVPAKPGPIGRGPKPGFENPRFPTIGPTNVNAHYGSIVDAREPINASLRTTIAAVKSPYSFYGQGGAGNSRAAFSQAMSNTSRNALLRSADEFNTGFRSQAEKARAQDVLSQRQNAHDRLRMDSQVAVNYEDTGVRHREGLDDIYARGQRARSAAQARITAAVIRMLSSLL